MHWGNTMRSLKRLPTCVMGSCWQRTWTTSTSSAPPHAQQTCTLPLRAPLRRTRASLPTKAKPECTTAWGAPRPPGIAALGTDVWCGSQPPEANGLVALGTPIGSDAFVAAHAHARLVDHQRYLREITSLPDLQAAWLLLLFTAAPRSAHLLRMLPPSQSTPYAIRHDDHIWAAFAALLNEPDGLPPNARSLASLPIRLGGLGLHASERLAPAAYWAAWADALPVLAARLPQLAERCVAALGDDSPAPCLREAAQSGSFLERQGWQSRPPWDTLTHLPRPPPTLAEREPGLPAHTSRLSSFKLLFASASCCLPCPRQPEPCSVPRLDPTPERG
jgi:hypothetical protein